MPLALSIYILLISVMESVNGGQFLNITPVPLLSATADETAALGTVIVPLSSLKINLTNSVTCSTRVIIYFNQIFCLKFRRLI